MNAWADNPQAAQIDALIEQAGRLRRYLTVLMGRNCCEVVDETGAS